MPLTAAQTRQLNEINEEIALIEKRLKRSHALGDSSNAGGISISYSDNQNWVRRLGRLRAQRNILEQLDSGSGVSRASLGITTINYIRNSTPNV